MHAGFNVSLETGGGFIATGWLGTDGVSGSGISRVCSTITLSLILPSMPISSTTQEGRGKPPAIAGSMRICLRSSGIPKPDKAAMNRLIINVF